MNKIYYKHTGYPGKTVTFKGSKSMSQAMNDPKHKLCPECQFEARNGHARDCSHRGGIRRFIGLKKVDPIRCPECLKAGRYGTLEKLTETEHKKLSEKEKDILPKVIFGCDECKYWIDGDIL